MYISKMSKADKTERTFIMVKVDGVQRGLVGEIIKRFEQKGYKLVALKFLKVSQYLTSELWLHLCSAAAVSGSCKAALQGPQLQRFLRWSVQVHVFRTCSCHGDSLLALCVWH